MIRGHKKVLRAVIQQRSLPFTSQAIPLDINKYCSVLLILIYLIPPKSKLTPYELLQQSRNCSFATAPPQFVLPILQGFNTHLTQSHMCCSTAGNATSTEIWQNNADLDPETACPLHCHRGHFSLPLALSTKEVPLVSLWCPCHHSWEKCLKWKMIVPATLVIKQWFKQKLWPSTWTAQVS